MPRNTAPRVDAADTDARCLDLRRAGLSYRQIAAQVGLSVANVHNRVTRSLDRTRREPADALRQLELDRLDDLQVAASRVLRATHHLVQGGRLVLDQHGRPYTDHGPTLNAINTLLRVGERRARLLGLDAPARVQADVQAEVYSIDALDRELRQLEAELAAADPTYVLDKQRQAAAARDLTAFRSKWQQPGHRPLIDVAGFIGDALELAVGQLHLDDEEQEQLAGVIERLLERAR